MAHKNPEQRRAYTAQWRRDNPDKVAVANRRAALKRKYGITPERYDEMVAKQGGTCGICKRPDPRGGTNRRGFWHVDHDHDTGEVRGLLCFTCNTALGHLGDDEAGLLRALDYLRRARTP